MVSWATVVDISIDKTKAHRRVMKDVDEDIILRIIGGPKGTRRGVIECHVP